jgi:hypothetical protein
MKELTTFTFADISSGDEVCIVIRYSEESVALAMSILSNGDLEVAMGKETLSKLIEALSAARSRLDRQDAE